jgi:hypothetical protein
MKLNPNLREHKMCLMKRRFISVEEAAQRAATREDKSVKLYLYSCPYCWGYHFTKHQRSLDPAVKDRVNIEMP